MFEIDFDIVIVSSFKEARSLRKYIKQKFGVSAYMKRGEYKISFDCSVIKKVNHFLDKNTFWRTHVINKYSVKDFIAVCNSSDNPSTLRKIKQQERQNYFDLINAEYCVPL